MRYQDIRKRVSCGSRRKIEKGTYQEKFNESNQTTNVHMSHKETKDKDPNLSIANECENRIEGMNPNLIFLHTVRTMRAPDVTRMRILRVRPSSLATAFPSGGVTTAFLRREGMGVVSTTSSPAGVGTLVKDTARPERFRNSELPILLFMQCRVCCICPLDVRYQPDLYSVNRQYSRRLGGW